MVVKKSPADDDDGNNPIAVETQAWETLLETKRSLKLTFMSQTMRPTISRGFHKNLRPHHQGGSNNYRGARTRNMNSRDPPDLDRMAPEDFVDNLEGMAGAAFSNVTQEVCVSLLIFCDPLFICICKGSLHHCRPARSTNVRSYRMVFISRRQLHRRISGDSNHLLAYTGD